MSDLKLLHSLYFFAICPGCGHAVLVSGQSFVILCASCRRRLAEGALAKLR